MLPGELVEKNIPPPDHLAPPSGYELSLKQLSLDLELFLQATTGVICWLLTTVKKRHTQSLHCLFKLDCSIIFCHSGPRGCKTKLMYLTPCKVDIANMLAKCNCCAMFTSCSLSLCFSGCCWAVVYSGSIRAFHWIKLLTVTFSHLCGHLITI